MAKLAVVVPFAYVAPHHNPNMAQNDQVMQVAAYFRAMVVAFASVKRWNCDVSLHLVTNQPPPDTFADDLSALGVAIKRVPFSHEPPEGFADRFAGSLYLLDALKEFEGIDCLVLDPDVLCAGSLRDMRRSIGDSCGALFLNYLPSRPVNGLSRTAASAIHGRLGLDGLAPHYGGECYFVSAAYAGSLNGWSEEAWAAALKDHLSGRDHMRTEEHILSYALRRVPLVELSPWVRRIWTTGRVRTVRGDECRLVLWHLPAEKERGFASLYSEVKDRQSWFWSADRDEFVRRCGRHMGLWKRSGRRLVRDVVGAVLSGRALSRQREATVWTD